MPHLWQKKIMNQNIWLMHIFQNIIANIKGHMKSECMHEIINFPKYCQKDLIFFCPESLFRLGMLCYALA